MDGTFSTVPDCFRQLYVIRAEIGTTCASCVYAFLPGKTEAVYTEMLEAVIAKFMALGFNTDPTVVITDFERAATSRRSRPQARMLLSSDTVHVAQGKI